MSSIAGAGGSTSTGETVAKVPVFLMAGQSNMEGYGPREDSDKGDWELAKSLAEVIADGEEQAQILQPRDDVWVHFDSDSPVQLPGLLAPGFGARPAFIGPELSFGQVVGDALAEPVVLYKTATGGTTLGADWRPPSAGGDTGTLYTRMISGFQVFLQNDVASTFPSAIQERGFDVAGFVWLQGWNDQFEDGFVAQYETNLVALVKDVRSDLGLPTLPAYVVEGPTIDEELRAARQAAVATLNAEQAGTVVLIETNDLVEEEIPGNFHFHFNAKNYLEVGRRTAEAVLAVRP